MIPFGRAKLSLSRNHVAAQQELRPPKFKWISKNRADPKAIVFFAL